MPPGYVDPKGENYEDYDGESVQQYEDVDLDAQYEDVSEYDTYLPRYGADGGDGQAKQKPGRPQKTGTTPSQGVEIKPLSSEAVGGSYEDFDARRQKQSEEDDWDDWDLDDDEFKQKKKREFFDQRPQWVGPKGKPIPREGRRPSPPPPPSPPAPPPMSAAQVTALATKYESSLEGIRSSEIRDDQYDRTDRCAAKHE